MASRKHPSKRIGQESGYDTVILHGDAYALQAPDRSLAVRLAEASAKKFDYAPKPDEVGAGGTFVFRPHVVFAWKEFPKDATRWDFQDAGS